jgi:hypothetical protein
MPMRSKRLQARREGRVVGLASTHQRVNAFRRVRAAHDQVQGAVRQRPHRALVMHRFRTFPDVSTTSGKARKLALPTIGTFA